MTKKKVTSANRILLPKMDVIFKLLFGDKRNSDILIDFLKSVLDLPEDEYVFITVVDPQLKRETINDKLGIVDVKLTTRSNKVIHIEIQVLELEEMVERVTYYNSKMLVTQIKSGDDYDILQKTISIVIADFDMIKGSPAYHHVFRLYDKNTDVLFTDIVEINTLELKKIPQITDDTKKYEWLQFLKAEQEEEFEMLAEKNPAINKAYAELKRLSQSEEAQLLYEERLKAIRDENARTKFALKKGRMEGRLEGKKEEKESIARNLLTLKLPIPQISQATGLKPEEIEKLAYQKQ